MGLECSVRHELPPLLATSTSSIFSSSSVAVTSLSASNVSEQGCLLADVGHVRGKITLPQKVLVSRALKSEVGKYSFWTGTRGQNHAWPQSSFSSQSSV